MTAYYNEIDPFAAAWLRELIKGGHIADGVVDERSIVDIRPDELAGYTQCHFFAGIGVWSCSLRRAGWPDDRPIWTGSCPCQPFSAAGAGGGFADERHLWPHFHWLIDQCGPAIVLGEQVASKDGLAWLDLVQADLEGSGYASAAVDTCSAGVGAPHIRQRLYWMAHSNDHEPRPRRDGGSAEGERLWLEPGGRGDAGRLDDDDARLEGQRGRHQAESGRVGAVRPVAEAGQSGGLADTDIERRSHEGLPVRPGRQDETALVEWWSDEGDQRPGPTNGFWRDADWIFCRDGKWRPVEPGAFPLAHGAPARVGRLRGYGNAINAVQAQIFIEVVKECIDT